MTSLRESLSYTPVELVFGTSGLRDLVSAMTDLECYINTRGFLKFLVAQNQLNKGERVLLGGDLRESTPRILTAMHQAITDGGFESEYHGLVPTPALAYAALEKNAPCIMVTGSHIPSDRNGVKFYKKGGEILRDDEASIKQFIQAERQATYKQEVVLSSFDKDGFLKIRPRLPAEDTGATEIYQKRYLSIFDSRCLAGKKIVFYQHSAVGRDLLVDLFTRLGAEVITDGRSEVFVPIDSENVTPEHLAYFKQLAEEHPGVFAIVSTDGDSDRPFVIDETGTFHRGDVLGAVVAAFLKADAAAFPVTASDAVDDYLADKEISFVRTKIGSPFVIYAMQEAAASGRNRVVGWEVNGGFLTGSDIAFEKGTLRALPTRDAFLPMLIVLIMAHKHNKSLSALFSELPQRFTDAGLINDFPVEMYKKFLSHYGEDTEVAHKALAIFFTPDKGFTAISKIDNMDGIRIYFENGDIAHVRQSNNAPQLRMYSVADSSERAREIVDLTITEPDGIFRQMERANQS